MPTIFLDRDLIIRSFTPAVAGLYNLIASDKGRPLTDIVSGLAYDGLKADIGHVMATLELIEKRVERLDGQAHYLMRVLPYRSAESVVEGVLITFNDVTSMVLAEQHDRLLVDELNHRVKNMLTVVISLASQTKRGTQTFEAFWDAFMGRLHALATAYDLLSRDQWTDIPLQDVLREELSPFMTGGRDTISLTGPLVFLRPKGALAFGMVVHELATNAVKYGALSVPSGHVEIGWRIVETAGRAALQWSWGETGGPPVTAPPPKFFGTSLIERSLKHEMNGTARLDFQPGGLQATLDIPFDTLILADATSRPSVR